MSRFDRYTNPALARRRFGEKVLFGCAWGLGSTGLGFLLLGVAGRAGGFRLGATFTGSPVADAVAMCLVVGFVLAVVVVLSVRIIRGVDD